MYRGMAALVALATLFLAPGARLEAPAVTADAPPPSPAMLFVFSSSIGGAGPSAPPASIPDTSKPVPTAAQVERPPAKPAPVATDPPSVVSQGVVPPSPFQPESAPAQVAAPTRSAPPTQAPPASRDEPVCTGAAMSAAASELLGLINSERASRGLRTLAIDPCAAQVAASRARDLASRGYFAHTSPDGSTAASLLAGLGVRATSAENLARNNYPAGESVAVAMRDLMASASHRGAILGAYSRIGVASADAGSVHYYVMVFLGG